MYGNTMKNILIVDQDPAFIIWLGQALLVAKQQPWPACSVSDAIELVANPGVPVDLLIVNSSMPGASELVGLLRRFQAHLKVIALGSEGGVELPRVDFWLCKPRPTNKGVEKKWLQVVKRLLTEHNRVPPSSVTSEDLAPTSHKMAEKQ